MPPSPLVSALSLSGILATLSFLLLGCDPPPGCAYGGTCGEDESRVCGSFCRPTATPEMIEASASGGDAVRCSVDPCDGAAYDDSNVATPAPARTSALQESANPVARTPTATR